MRKRRAVPIPIAPPGPDWYPRLLQDLGGLETMERFGAPHHYLCIFCRTPLPDRGGAQRRLNGKAHRFLELPDGTRLRLAPVYKRQAVCLDCARIIARARRGTLAPAYPTFPACYHCRAYIMVISREMSHARRVSVHHRYASKGPIPVAWDAEQYLCLACWRELGERATQFPYQTPEVNRLVNGTPPFIISHYVLPGPPQAYPVDYVQPGRAATP